MDQIKIGLFLKKLRKEKNLTQETLAEKFNISNRTISRWETGSNMPDISLLIELSEFYGVSILEIINGEKNGEERNQELKDTTIKMAEYSKNEVKIEKRKVISSLMIIFGVFQIITALAIFPNDSSWGSIYSIIGGTILIAGIYFMTKSILVKRSSRILCVGGCIVFLFGVFTVSDYIAVAQFNQAPRFCYLKSYGDNEVEYTTIFFTAIRKNIGTKNEYVEILK